MASGPYSAPWTDTGRLQGDIDRLQSTMHGKADSHEVSSLRSSVDSLEHSNRELRSDLDEVRRQLAQLQENFRESLNVLGQMAEFHAKQVN